MLTVATTDKSKRNDRDSPCRVPIVCGQTRGRFGGLGLGLERDGGSGTERSGREVMNFLHDDQKF